jgi:hypothetical protein
MAFLGFGKKRDDVLDLSERYKKQQEQLRQMRAEAEATKPQTFASASENASENAFSFLGGMANVGNSESQQNTSSSDYLDVSSDIGEKRRRLTKRILDMTEKLEEISNQIYHLTQRIEVLEKKSGVGVGY